MRTKFCLSMIAGVAMTASLASCSNDDVVPSPENPNQGGGANAYAKVSITMKGTGSRATEGTPDKFDPGKEDESKVNSITLVVYDEDNGVVAYGSIGAQTYADGSKASISHTYSDQVVELTMVGDKEKAAKLVAYINTNVDVNKAFDERAVTDAYEENGFVMTNAGYFTGYSDSGNGTWTTAVEIEESDIYPSKTAASSAEDAVEIYVERLAAKVTTKIALTAPEEGNQANINIVGYYDQKEYGLEFDEKSIVWAPTQTAKTMYTVKNAWTEKLGKWANDVSNFRSYWAAGVLYETEYSKMQGDKDNGYNMNFVSSNDLRRSEGGKGKTSGDADYTLEHTYGSDVVTDDDYNKLGAATSVMVLGKYKVTGEGAGTKFSKTIKGEGNNSYEGYDFYLLLNGAGATDSYYIFTEGELIQYLLENNKLELYTSYDHREKIDASNATTYFELKFDSPKYVLNKKATVYDKEGSEMESPSLEEGTNARHYNLGYAYFFVPIEHLGEEGVGKYGVVRNHSYNLTITEIKSLGAPLDDDHFGTDPDKEDPDPDDPGEEPIIPDPTNAAFLKAEINVLSWHVVDQSVQL